MTETAPTDRVPTDTPHTDTPHTDTPRIESSRREGPHTEADRPPLERSRTHLMVGGVAAGLARHTGIDVLLWRLGFVALVFAGGAGFILYLALWLLVPAAPAAADDRTNVLDEWVERLRARFTRTPTRH